MLIAKYAKPWLVCSGDEARLILTEPYLEVTDAARGFGRVVATDAIALVYVPVVCELGDVSGSMPARAVRAGSYADGKRVRVLARVDGAHVRGGDRVARDHVETALTGRAFPLADEQLAPALAGRRGERSLVVNKERLVALLRAVGTETVELGIAGECDLLRVTGRPDERGSPADEAGTPWGYLMPLRVR